MINGYIAEKLKKTGLEEKEATIYGYLVESGGAFPSEISEHTKINRSTVYKTLGILSVRGLVGEVEKKKKLFYYPESPAKFLRAMKTKISFAEDAYKKAESLIPELEGFFKNHENKPRVTFYEGREQVIAAYFTQALEKKYELLAFANTDQLLEFMTLPVLRDFIKQKEKNGISARGIIPDTPTARKFSEITHSDVKKNLVAKPRFVPHAMFPFPGEIIMYGKNKVFFVKFDANAPIAVIIEDETIHNMMKMIFELAYAQAKE
jgi:sugar-specific transcriptional regulator TrmB